MKIVIGAIVLLITAIRLTAQTEIVNGFHGYKWGTPVAEVKEIRGTVMLRDNAGSTYMITTNMLGLSGNAVFQFDPSGRLISGAYFFPVTYTNCEREWATFETALTEAFPALAKTRATPTMERGANSAYSGICEYFAYNGSQLEWITRFSNPRSLQPELGMAMTTQGLKLTMNVLYQGDAANRAGAARLDSDRAKLGPVGESPPTAPATSAAPPKPIVPPKGPFVGNPGNHVYYSTVTECWRSRMGTDTVWFSPTSIISPAWTRAPDC